MFLFQIVSLCHFGLVIFKVHGKWYKVHYFLQLNAYISDVTKTNE